MLEVWGTAIAVPGTLVLVSVAAAVHDQWMTAAIVAWILIGLCAFAVICFVLYHVGFERGKASSERKS